MPLTIDVADYRRLPPGVRARFDGWLEAEHLVDKRIVQLTLAEGEVVVEGEALDEAGRLILDESGERAMVVIARYPVRSLPPEEAFAR